MDLLLRARGRRRTAVLAAAAILGSCDLLDPGVDPVPGYLQGVVGSEPEIEVPEGVLAGEAVVVEITTWGLSGCWGPHETRVSVDGLDASVRPFDREPGDMDGRACTANIPAFSHRATLRFEETGTAWITVTGRRFPEGTAVSHVREVRILDPDAVGG